MTVCNVSDAARRLIDNHADVMLPKLVKPVWALKDTESDLLVGEEARPTVDQVQPLSQRDPVGDPSGSLWLSTWLRSTATP